MTNGANKLSIVLPDVRNVYESQERRDSSAVTNGFSFPPVLDGIQTKPSSVQDTVSIAAAAVFCNTFVGSLGSDDVVRTV